MRSRMLLAVLLAVWPGVLYGQADSLVTPGARVRLRTAGLRPTVRAGTLVRIEGDTVVVDSIRVGIPAVSRFQVSRGTKSAWVTGLVVGSLIGATAGVVAGSAVDCGELGGVCVLAFGGIGLGGGALAGLLVGAFTQVERWHDVPLQGLRPTAYLGTGGTGLGIALSF